MLMAILRAPRSIMNNTAQRCCRVSNRCDVIVTSPLTSRPHCYLIEFPDNHVISIGAHHPQNSVSLIPQVQLITLSVRINERRNSRYTKCVYREQNTFLFMPILAVVHVIQCILIFINFHKYLHSRDLVFINTLLLGCV